jgi:hypothetical protein
MITYLWKAFNRRRTEIYTFTWDRFYPCSCEDINYNKYYILSMSRKVKKSFTKASKCNSEKYKKENSTIFYGIYLDLYKFICKDRIESIIKDLLE